MRPRRPGGDQAFVLGGLPHAAISNDFYSTRLKVARPQHSPNVDIVKQLPSRLYENAVPGVYTISLFRLQDKGEGYLQQKPASHRDKLRKMPNERNNPCAERVTNSLILSLGQRP